MIFMSLSHSLSLFLSRASSLSSNNSLSLSHTLALALTRALSLRLPGGREAVDGASGVP
jgi:hypothetical protein